MWNHQHKKVIINFFLSFFRTRWEPESEPTPIPITNRLPPIGKSESDHNGPPPPAENSPKRKKKSRRRRKAPDGQLDDSFEPEYQPRPLPQPSALKKLPPIEHIDTDFGRDNKAFQSTELWRFCKKKINLKKRKY